MTQSQPTAPAPDLTNCDREPIHILGRVQSFGALIAVSSDWLVNHVSANIGEILPGLTADDLIGRPLMDFISGDAIHDMRSRLQLLGSADAIERLFARRLTDSPDLFDVALHMSGRSVIIEIERNPDDEHLDLSSYIRPMVDRISKSGSIPQLCQVAAKQIRALTGFDRVMVYQFQPDGSGAVVAEALGFGVESFKGLRYPASDIPRQARELYKRSLLRIISDVHDEGSAIHPQVSPSGEPLDLSLSSTRAVSPIHLQYLKNMGVDASMSISILKRGELWGLFACHHMQPRVLPYGIRTATELFGQIFSFVLDQKDADLERAERVKSQKLHDQLMMQLTEGARIEENFDKIASVIEEAIPYDGIVGWVDGKFFSRGQTPTAPEFADLARFLNTAATSSVYANENLISTYEAAKAFADRAAGILVLPVSRTPRDFIVLFRGEIINSVSWAGNPEKPVDVDSGRLTPRASFQVWREMVRGHCTPWTPAEIHAAENLRITLLEVVLRLSDAALREHAQAQNRQELLIQELNHRVRNILNLIRGLVNQSQAQATSPAEFTKIVGGRIHALARAHDLITKKNWDAASVNDLITLEIEAYLADNPERVIVEGPDVLLEPGAFTTVALVIHEMITNSAKYGALSVQDGELVILMMIGSNGALQIDWRETGGPAIVSAPSRRGFGTTIIEKSIPFELGGVAELDFAPIGLQARFEIPSSYVTAVAESDGAAGKATRAPVVRSMGKMLSGDVMIVEDNMIIALDAEEFVSELGGDPIHVVASVGNALQVLEGHDIRFALLDISLGADTSEPVARELRRRGIPFAFATGYGDRLELIKRFPGCPVIQKPYSKADIARAIETGINSVEEPPQPDHPDRN